MGVRLEDGEIAAIRAALKMYLASKGKVLKKLSAVSEQEERAKVQRVIDYAAGAQAKFSGHLYSVYVNQMGEKRG